MHRNARTIASWIGLLVALAGTAMAQQITYRVRADIPVDFYVSDQLRAAGSYMFTVNCGDNAVTITNLANNHSSVVLASPIQDASTGYDRRDSKTQAVVEFNSVGGKYVLADIQTLTSGVSFASEVSNASIASNKGVVRVAAVMR